MRIRNINIGKWRHFEDIDISLGDDTSLVCIVGANGTGKSHLLELIAACAHHLGLAQGVEIPRGDPFNDAHEFSLKFYIAVGVSPTVEQELSQDISFPHWDRTMTLHSKRDPTQGTASVHLEAGGIVDPGRMRSFSRQVVEILHRSSDVYFLSLDADRAYPRRSFNDAEIAQAYRMDWSGKEYTKGRAFKPTSTLYDEWTKYCLAIENNAGNNLLKNIRIARSNGTPDPVFSDHFLPYKEAITKVLPHLVFIGVDTVTRQLIFDTTGIELSFGQMSGGEREIAFLIGQIDRFRLRQGLFLLDEPELHLNADLIRTWVAYLTSTVTEGQVWLATHSLEAVEAAGQQATFVLERNEQTRKVDSLARLDRRPVLSALSRAVGTPAFSISSVVFVFIEGEERLGERERYRNLADSLQNFRFMECGSCTEVTRRVSIIKALAQAVQNQIRIGGVVDRDFHSDAQAKDLTDEFGVFVLPVHEVENLFLSPQTLTILLSQNGKSSLQALDLVRSAADDRAGSWIFQHALASPIAKSLPALAPAAKDCAKSMAWDGFARDRNAAIQRIVGLAGFDTGNEIKLHRILSIFARLYEKKRIEEDLWKTCEGKQVLNAVAQPIGFADAAALVQASFAAWTRDETRTPAEVLALRTYLASL